MHQFEFEDLPRRRGSRVFVSTGKLKMALARDRMRRAFGRFVYGVDLRPRPLRYAGRLAISQVKDPPRLPERVRVPESPRLLWVSGLLCITVIVRCVTTVRVAVRRAPIFGVALRRIAIRWVAVRGISLR